MIIFEFVIGRMNDIDSALICAQVFKHIDDHWIG